MEQKWTYECPSTTNNTWLFKLPCCEGDSVIVDVGDWLLETFGEMTSSSVYGAGVELPPFSPIRILNRDWNKTLRTCKVTLMVYFETEEAAMQFKLTFM